MSWWDKASLQDKLTQVKAGIELGMTSKQIATNLRAPVYSTGDAVRNFGRYHGLTFASDELAKIAGRSMGGKRSSIVQARSAGKPEISASDAFDIFPRSETNEFALFEEMAL